MIRNFFILLGSILALVVVAVLLSGAGFFGFHEGAGEIRGGRRPASSVAARAAIQASDAAAIGADSEKQILFGDLHVHTTLSTDAFMLSLPISQGEGSHPPADACDFARYCSTLDFWSINDHAEGLTPRQWNETIESIRQCNELTGSELPDTVAFLGWEWTQVGTTPEDHYGHKNVVIAGLDDDEIPTRPIASTGQAQAALAGPGIVARGLLGLSGGGQRMQDFARFLAERKDVASCPEGVPVRELPLDCAESAATPGELFRKLDDWGFDSIVIPHGTSWGMYTPPGSTWSKQLSQAQHDPKRQTLVEIFSGHGNAEEYRDWRAVEGASPEQALCPLPSAHYTPSCWRAGEIIFERCLAENLPADECESRADETRKLAAASGVAMHHVVSGESPDDWLDAGQCTDCFLPPFNHRPGSSVQYMMAIRNFSEAGGPERFRFGFIGSSDNHFARPGTGYKEIHRRGMSESRNLTSAPTFLDVDPGDKLSTPVPFDIATTRLRPFQLVELERQSSFFMTGGLIAAHSAGRGRADIWDSLERREVYATSGPRILLWFDLVPEPAGRVADARIPMGSSIRMTGIPRFVVRAVGSFEQKPGCPDSATRALSAEDIEHLCKGECYHPSDERRSITRIEVVRIRPQISENEPLGQLIEDPWRVFECDGRPEGCRVEFVDAEFMESARDTLYYVRAIEATSPTINADPLGCVRDELGRCTAVRRCGTPGNDLGDCLSESEERAWSSPIFVDWAG